MCCWGCIFAWFFLGMASFGRVTLQDWSCRIPEFYGKAIHQYVLVQIMSLRFFWGHHESSWFPNVAYIVIDNWPPIDSKMPWNYEHCVLSHRYIHTFIYNCFHCWGPVSALNPLGYNVPCPLPTFPPKFRFWKRSKRSDARKWMTEFVMLGRLGQHGHFTLLVVSL